MYILSIKQVKDIFGKELSASEYTSYDNFSGSMSSGYPIFADLYHANTFLVRSRQKNGSRRIRNTLICFVTIEKA